MLLPLLTEKDPVVSSEGSLDPLGTYTIADAMAVKLIPGVRERQTHPRFLTAVAVSTAVCSVFDSEQVAADGISEPWQVFEWYLVEGLARTKTESVSLSGLPGIDKARRAIQDRVPLSASRYLKTPSVFGFHGVYRLLSKTLGLQIQDRLGEFGYDLLTAWAHEQGLKGFYGTEEGPGTEWRIKLEKAVRDGLEKGAVARTGSWDGWSFFANHLGIYDVRPNEAGCIHQALLNDAQGYRHQVLDFLISDEGLNLWHQYDHVSVFERHFHAELRNRSDEELKGLLKAIMTYETFSRIIQNAFEDCLYVMTRKVGKVHPEELAGLESVRHASEQISSLFIKLLDLLELTGRSVDFQQTFEPFSQRLKPNEWVQMLFEHHRKVQYAKPPNGKSPWVERFDDGSFIIRPMYRRDSGGQDPDGYLHAYRASSLWSFMKDLGILIDA